MPRDHNEVELERQESERINKRGSANQNNYSNGSDNINYSGSGSPNGGCFPKGTNISTPNGNRDISEIQKGDLVYSKHPDSNVLIAKPVLKVKNYLNKKIWKLIFKEGSSIRTTSVHSFRVGRKWKKASDLKEGDQITHYDDSGKLYFKTIKASHLTREIEDVFNLIIKDNYNFIADGSFVHSFSYIRNFRMLIWKLRTKLSVINYSNFEERIA